MSAMKVDTSYQSPNWNDRPAGMQPSLIVLHADGDRRVSDAIAFCLRTDAERRVSYHAIIGRLGDIYSLVPATKNAWHAGASKFGDECTRHVNHDGTEIDSVNGFSIGICFSNRQDGREEFSDAQLSAGALLVDSTMAAYPAITLERITTHGLVAVPGPNKRKVDPCPAGPFSLADFLERVRSIRKRR